MRLMQKHAIIAAALAGIVGERVFRGGETDSFRERWRDYQKVMTVKEMLCAVLGKQETPAPAVIRMAKCKGDCGLADGVAGSISFGILYREIRKYIDETVDHWRVTAIEYEQSGKNATIWRFLSVNAPIILSYVQLICVFASMPVVVCSAPFLAPLTAIPIVKTIDTLGRQERAKKLGLTTKYCDVMGKNKKQKPPVAFAP